MMWCSAYSEKLFHIFFMIKIIQKSLSPSNAQGCQASVIEWKSQTSKNIYIKSVWCLCYVPWGLLFPLFLGEINYLINVKFWRFFYTVLPVPWKPQLKMYQFTGDSLTNLPHFFFGIYFLLCAIINFCANYLHLSRKIVVNSCDVVLTLCSSHLPYFFCN